MKNAEALRAAFQEGRGGLGYSPLLSPKQFAAG